jgi:hypothetical protein
LLKNSAAREEVLASEIARSEMKVRELTQALEEKERELQAAKSDAIVKQASINLPGTCYDDIMAFALAMQEKAALLVKEVAEKGEELKKRTALNDSDTETSGEQVNDSVEPMPANATESEASDVAEVIAASSDESEAGNSAEGASVNSDENEVGNTAEVTLLNAAEGEAESESAVAEPAAEKTKKKTTRKASSSKTGTKKSTSKSSSSKKSTKSSSGTRSSSRKKKTEENPPEEQDIMTLEEIAANTAVAETDANTQETEANES